ncbi:hypothetical protein [Paludibacterium purpuratum]|uniref:Uncharacterized protein n=1 Tax=Paludibacterium purpuratum TaxID=1144873 RepID=A0A4R7B7F9_9NEIS|nr:hypothetical protein [Paludibacterium purpuratum]TDR80641.1 hypothetical protein DFP86_104140 [Paludibacterium purpuratum]
MDNLVENTVCIDLPGQDAHNIMVGCANRVILRKHRDIIIDIKLGNNAQYTLQATGKAQRDWFYDPKSKKLLTKLDFKDGERCHVWVGRNIRAELHLRCNGKVINRINVKQMDCTHGCSEDPKEKPAPLIFTLRPQQQTAPASAAAPHTNSAPSPQSHAPAPAQPVEHIRVLQVPQSAYTELKSVAQFVANGGTPTAVDKSDVITRNWIINQISTVGVSVAQKATIFKELGTTTFYLRKYGNNVYIIFREWPQLRKEYNAAKYKTSNIKAVQITAGAGSLKEAGKAAWEAPGGALASKAGRLLFLLQITTDVAEWWHDSQTIDPKTGKPISDVFDLAAKMLTDVAFFWIGAIATSLVGSVLVALAGGVGATVGVAVAAVLVGGVVVSVLLGMVDNKLHITGSLAKALRGSFEYLNQYRPKDYHAYGPHMMPVLSWMH